MSERYRTIVIDPPWPEIGGGKIKRGADRHYPVIPCAQMPYTILASGVWRPDGNCHLYLWATNNYLAKGIWLLEALGFRYVTCLTWVKDGQPGLGQYFRGRREQLLFGVAGRLPALVRDQDTVITAARGRHSEKPLSAYMKIERVSPGPRLEMFARNKRPGWDVWGNEVTND